MEIEIQKYLYDIQKSCEFIYEFTDGQNFEDYQNNRLLKSAVKRQFITIGEALNQAIKRNSEISSYIANTRKIIDFRNLLPHQYGAVSDAVAWDIVQTNLPELMDEVTQLLSADS